MPSSALLPLASTLLPSTLLSLLLLPGTTVSVLAVQNPLHYFYNKATGVEDVPHVEEEPLDSEFHPNNLDDEDDDPLDWQRHPESFVDHDPKIHGPMMDFYRPEFGDVLLSEEDGTHPDQVEARRYSTTNAEFGGTGAVNVATSASA